jgi:DNA polymerase III epsilon subunit-like protein
MEYISIDIETTGLDEHSHQILEFGAIIEDTHNPLSFEESKKFHAIIRSEYDDYTGSAFALQLNQRIFKILAKRGSIKDFDELTKYDDVNNIVKEDDFVEAFYNWCCFNLQNKPATMQDKVNFIAAGKNFAKFDLQFLKQKYDWNQKFNVHHRIIDPASMFWRPMEDKALPSLDTCMERAGIDAVVGHDAIGDAWQVIQVLRTKY